LRFETRRAPHSFPTRRSSDLKRNWVLTPTSLADQPVVEFGSIATVRNRPRRYSAVQEVDHVHPQSMRHHQQVAELHLLPGLHLRSEEHTSELQSRENLVCRLL